MIGKVLSIKKNPQGIYGFIQTDEGDYYYDTASLTKGNFLKVGVKVQFDVISWQGDRTKAIRVKIINDNVEKQPLEDDIKGIITELIVAAMGQDTFLDFSVVSGILSEKGIDYKKYADNLSAFFGKYFVDFFSVKKNLTINNKTYPAVLINRKVANKDISEDVVVQIREGFLAEISEVGFIQAVKIPSMLRNFGILQYRDYSASIDSFIEKYIPNTLVAKKNVYVNGKRYPKIFVLIEDENKFVEAEETKNTLAFSENLELDEQLRIKVKNGLKDAITENGFILGSEMPNILRMLGIVDYKALANSIEEFISAYYQNVFEMKKNVVIGDKKYSSIITLKEESGETDESEKSDESGKLNKESLVAHLKEMLSDHEFEEILRLEEVSKLGPQSFGVSGIESLLKAVAGFLGEDIEHVQLNDYHRLLIEAETVSDLKPFKDDEILLRMGAETAIIPMSVEEYKRVFADIHNGKKNHNLYWNAIVERFWTAQSEFAIYLTCLWLVIIKHEKCIDLYIDEAAKYSRIDQLVLLMRINQAFGRHNVTIRLQRKIMGRCFDLNDVETLVSASTYFGTTALQGTTELMEFLSGRIQPDSNLIMNWFHSEIGPQIAEKIVNYYWWKFSAQGISIDLFKVLGSVYWEYPENYYTEIIYNPSCPLFGRKDKELILKNSFNVLCNMTRTYKKAYPWINYLYLTLLAEDKDDRVDSVWEELRSWMSKEVLSHFSDDIGSAGAIALFRLDIQTRTELETKYCESYVTDIIDGFSVEEELDEFVELCEKQGLQFITQWIIKHSNATSISNEEVYVTSLCFGRNFIDAIKYIQESNLGNEKKINLIRFVLCENFKAYNVDDEAFTIFERCIPINVAEAALTMGLNFTEHDVIAALIALYIYKKEWAKAAYLLAPFRAFYLDAHRKLIEDVRILAHNEYNVDLMKCWANHYEVVKRALRIYDIKEFDSFVEWTQIIKIPTGSNKYALSPRTFDSTIQSMISGGDKDSYWNQLVRMALQTDNNDRQDNLRFCIIASYIGRYGIDATETVINSLVRNPNATKGYADFYISLWKGLLNGKYSVNFLRLCQNLIGVAPITFWNLFYDIAVIKNHVFSSDDYELNTWRNDQQKFQGFYSDVLNYYVETREIVYLKIAISLLKDCEMDLVPEFDKYVSFCNSSRNKSFLLSALATLLERGKYKEAIGELVSSEYWRCSNSEHEMLRLLNVCCMENMYVDDEYESMTENELDYFKRDCLRCIKNFPELDIEYALCHIDSNGSYRLKVITALLKIQYMPVMRGETENAPEINDGWRKDARVSDYLKFVGLLYQKQLQGDENLYNDAVFVKNRYVRIFVSKLLLEDKFEDYSDDQVIALMSANKHLAAVYSDYEIMKKYIFELLQSSDDSEFLKVVFLIGLLSNKWEQFISNANNYSSNALAIICKLEEQTNYRDLNMQIIRGYLLDLDVEVDDVEIAYLETCSPKVFAMLRELKQIKQYSEPDYLDAKKLINGICRLQYQGKAQRSYTYMKHALQTYSEELKKNWDLFMLALEATSYKKTIIVNLLDEIKKRKIDVNEIKLWMPVFRSFGNLSVYYYMLAVRYALDRKKENAIEAFSSISEQAILPKEWVEDIKNLRGYLLGKSHYFSMVSNSTLQTLAIEKDAEAVSFINTVFCKDEITSSIAVKAYKSILSKDTEDIVKINAYKQLFGFVKKPDDLFDIYRQAEGRGSEGKNNRLTYNELVIEYGSLLICMESELTTAQKMQILLELFGVFEFLNDINKGKNVILERLSVAEQSVLETPGVSFENWIENKDKIISILKHPAIQCPETIIAEFCKPLDECVVIINNCSSEMQKLSELSAWRVSWNLQQNCSNYEYAFIRSVDEKIKELKSGVNLSVNIVNKAMEDNCIFYCVENKAEISNATVSLSNSSEKGAARLEVFVGIKGSEMAAYEGAAFTNIVELRPGDVCGQYYRLHNNVVSAIKSGDLLTVTLNVIVENSIICNCTSNFIYRNYDNYSLLRERLISDVSKYETSVPAFSHSIKGFGRDIEKRLIQQYLEEQLVVIYGPSRVGKSSLVNYISNEYIRDYSVHEDKSIIAIGIADDRHGNDYCDDMLNDEEKISFDNSSRLLRYLFISPLRIAFGSESRLRLKSRMRCKYAGEKLANSARDEIYDIVCSDGSVREIMTVVSQILEENNCQVWYLFDEFQQIVERWEGDTKELTDLCNDIMNHQSSIKLVICGSDDLVRLYQCENDTKWRDFVQKTADNGVMVGQLSPEDFEAMMKDETIWSEVSKDIPWSSEALELLYQYTGGNAICGKLFGNELINKVRRGEFERRERFYPSDITQVAYELLNSEVGLVRNLLILHNTKNLEDEIPYLLFIAHELVQERNRADVSIRRIREFFSVRTPMEIENALKVLIARGILKVNEEKQRYGFATMFYFDFFRSQATEVRLQELSMRMQEKLPDEEDSMEIVDPLNLQYILQYFKDADPEVQNGFLGGLAANAKDKDALKGLIGTTQSGNIFNGETTINHVNIQSITNTLNGIMTTGDPVLLLKGIEELPRLSIYLPQLAENSEENVSRAMDNYVADMEESIEASCKQNGKKMPECWKILKFESEPDFENFKGEYGIPQCFFDSLQFAYQLEILFEEGSLGENVNEIDYSPVTIMYCKLVETLLKEYHIGAYSDALSSVETELNYKKNGKKYRYRWGDIKRLTQYQKQKLTIGSFVFPIVNDNEHRDHIVDLATNTPGKSVEWETHAEFIKEVRDIRNPSAHGNKNHKITHEQMLNIKKGLIDKGGLRRMITIVKEPI